MSGPQRIQRKREKGWRMPEGAIYVGRPSVWGNPYTERDFGRVVALRLFALTARGGWDPRLVWDDGLREVAYRLHVGWQRRLAAHPFEAARWALRGHDLACWCPLADPCHADVLLEIANEPARTRR